MKFYPPRIKYINGMRFNNFIIVERVDSIITHKGRSYTAWNCKCDCGEYFIGRTKEIQKGLKSCGCLSKSNRFKLISNEENITKLKLNHYKSGATRRNIEFKLGYDEFYKLIIGDCYYCGSKPFLDNKTKYHSMLTNGIDRVENNKGYINTNVVSCCRFCNSAKGKYSVKEFEEWIKRLINFRK